MNFSHVIRIFWNIRFLLGFQTELMVSLSCLRGVAPRAPVRYRERPAPATGKHQFSREKFSFGMLEHPTESTWEHFEVILWAHLSSNPCSSYELLHPSQKSLTMLSVCQTRHQSRSSAQFLPNWFFSPSRSSQWNLRCLLAEPPWVVVEALVGKFSKYFCFLNKCFLLLFGHCLPT